MSVANSLLSSPELSEKIKSAQGKGEKAIAYLPVGCIEQHGPYLPLETDSLIARHITASLVGHMGENGSMGCIFPGIDYTPTQTNAAYCGTVSVHNDIFRNYFKQICQSILSQSFDTIVIISGHGSVDPILKEVAFWLVNEQYSAGSEVIKPVIVLSIFEYSWKIEDCFKQKPGKHADWREFLFIYKILGANYFTQERLDKIEIFNNINIFPHDYSIIYGVPMEYRSTEGVIGEPLPTLNKDWGSLSDKLWDITIDSMYERLKHELEQFYENNYHMNNYYSTKEK